MKALFYIIGLSMFFAAQCWATDAPHARSRPAICVSETSNVLRTAYHPGQVPVRCTRFLATTTVQRARIDPHT